MMDKKINIMKNTNMNNLPYSYDKILNILTTHASDDEASLFAEARKVRQSMTGNKIFIYGFIYLSTYCRNACTFCLYSKKNKELSRYRKNLSEILEIAKRLADDGVHLLDLTLGEDPYFVEEKGLDQFLEIIRKVKDTTQLPIMVSPGVLPQNAYTLLRQAGADWYACYQETHDRQEFARLRPQQDFDLRINSRKWAHEAGLLVEDGLLTGTGESMESLAQSIDNFKTADLNQSRIMTYVGHESTIPMHALAKNTELRAISLLRLTNPQHLIPASLDIDGLEGLESRIMAGANLITSIVPAGFGLNGVASADKDIENQQRSVVAVKERLKRLDLELASVADYKEWIENTRKNNMLQKDVVS